MSAHLFVDESRRGSYLLVAARVLPPDLARTRTLLRGLRYPGDVRLHFNTERDSRRRIVLARLVEARLCTTVYTGRGRPEEVRKACLQVLTADACKQGVGRLVLESRGRSLDQNDRLVIARTLRQAGAGQRLDGPAGEAAPMMTYEHLQPHEDPVLWLADAVAWSYGAGGAWRARVGPIVEAVIDLGQA
jgi:hypothetical protein